MYAKNPVEKWYQQFWPWFLIALPASVVVAGFYTLFIALTNPHSMVDDNYYKEGLAINKSLEQDRQATALGLRAQVNFLVAQNQVEVVLTGPGDWPGLALLMLHPGLQTLDQVIGLRRTGAGQYRGALAQAYHYSYYLRLVPQDKRWRLNGQIDFQYGSRTALEHD